MSAHTCHHCRRQVSNVKPRGPLGLLTCGRAVCQSAALRAADRRTGFDPRYADRLRRATDHIGRGNNEQERI